MASIQLGISRLSYKNASISLESIFRAGKDILRVWIHQPSSDRYASPRFLSQATIYLNSRGTVTIPEAFQRFEQRLVELHQLDLSNPIWNWKPIFSSEQLMEMLQVKGKLVGEAITECLCWQIQNVEGGWDHDRCREHLVAWKHEKQARK